MAPDLAETTNSPMRNARRCREARPGPGLDRGTRAKADEGASFCEWRDQKLISKIGADDKVIRAMAGTMRGVAHGRGAEP